jgi:DnaB-like helicase C terminal domain
MSSSRIPRDAPSRSSRRRRGDLIFIGAYTSHGKSALLRFLAYILVIEHGLNVAFWSLEMEAEVVRTQFAILHANNKILFPDTPRIRYQDYKLGKLDAEQEDFVFRHAGPDFAMNPAYGSLLIEQPNSSRFTLADLTRRIGEIETTEGPVHALVIDYVTYMHPLPADRIVPPQPSDYNQMIKELKRTCLAHRHANGQSGPLICLTAAQISRRGYAEALKQNGTYELAAFSTYTEIERSADIAITSFMDQQNPSNLYLQVLKNRDGKTRPERLQLYIDPEGGFGMYEMRQHNAEEIRKVMSEFRFSF